MAAFDELVERIDRAAQSALGGVEVTYTPQSGSPVVVTGMFDEPYVLAKGNAEAGVEALDPRVSLRLSDLPANPEDDEPTLTIKGVNYRVTERQPDGMGSIVLGLQRLT